MSESLLSTLRQSTAAAHAEIEGRLEMEEACRDVDKYRGILQGFLGYYEPIEARLKGFEDRGKSGWLRSDLAALGMTEAEIGELPRCPHLPTVETRAEVLGCAYVLEGATLGGRQISGWLEGRDVIPAGARAFFASYGGEVGAKWKDFCKMLADFEAGGGASNDVVKTANETFLTLTTWMTVRKEAI